MPETYSPAHQLPEQEMGYPLDSPQSLNLRSRLLHSRLGRSIITTLAAASLYTGIGVANASSAEADAAVVYEVGNTDGGVFSRNSPHTNDTPRIVGQGAYDGDKVELLCGVTNGDAVGPYSNNTWHYARNLSRPHQPLFWISDRYVKSPNVADQLAPGEKNCNEQTPSPKQAEQPGCYFNFKWEKRNLTFSYEGDHRYYGNAWQAAKNWTELNAGISITPAPEGQQGDIVFKDEFILQETQPGEAISERSTWYGRAYVPTINTTTAPQSTEVTPTRVDVKISTPYVDTLNDFSRTYVFTHEIGHVLGLAHPEACRLSNSSVLAAGRGKLNENQPSYNKPQEYDKAALIRKYN